MSVTTLVFHLGCFPGEFFPLDFPHVGVYLVFVLSFVPQAEPRHHGASQSPREGEDGGEVVRRASRKVGGSLHAGGWAKQRKGPERELENAFHAGGGNADGGDGTLQSPNPNHKTLN